MENCFSKIYFFESDEIEEELDSLLYDCIEEIISVTQSTVGRKICLVVIYKAKITYEIKN